MDLELILKKVKRNSVAILGMEQFRHYAILIPMIYIDGKIHLLFEVRSLQLKKQPGEVCFPGGGVEKNDQTTRETAIRETSEELGIDQNRIHHVHPLDYIVQSMQGRIIYPYVGFIERFEEVKPNPEEVKEIFTIPIDYFKDYEPEEHKLSFQIQHSTDFPYHLIPGGENYSWNKREITEYFYFYKNYVIWGLTANILRNFLSIIYE